MTAIASKGKGQTPWAAVLCLLLAVGAVIWALRADERGTALQGPSGFATLPDGGIWLVLNDELWHLDAEGRRSRTVDRASLGLDRMPGSLLLRPGHDELYALPRGTDTVSVLSAQTAKPLRQVRLAWPDDLRQHLGTALWLAVHEDGRMAVANGGGHTVTLFDPQGRYLARSRPGTFRFTNDLWWDGDDLWTTDTNRFALVRLDGRDLTERQRRQFPTEAPHAYIALADPHPGAHSANGALATLARMGNGMVKGSVTFVFEHQPEQVLALSPQAEPRDFAWRREDLLVVDGADWRLKRFALDGHALEDFGHPDVVRDVQRMLADKQRWQAQYQQGLVAAIALFVLGLGLAWRDQRRRLQPALVSNAEALRFVGTPNEPMWTVLWKLAHVHLPWWLLAANVLLVQQLKHLRRWWPQIDTLTAWGLVGLSLLVAVAILAWMPRWYRRVSRHPRHEAALNLHAMTWLKGTSHWADAARPGEHVRETWTMQHGLQRHWLILTNRRLLVFAAPPSAKGPVARWYRAGIEQARIVRPSDMGFVDRLRTWGRPGCWLHLRMSDGTTLQGQVPSQATAKRVLSHLGLAAGWPLKVKASVPPVTASTSVKVWRAQVLASCLIPGAGQWWQRRRMPALGLFVLWAGWMALAAHPVVWAWWHVTTEVSDRQLLLALVPLASSHLASGLDAWYHRPGLR